MRGMFERVREMPGGIRLFLLYAFLILAGIGLSLCYVIDQAIAAPVSLPGIIVMVLLGGMGTLAGPLLGAAAFLLLENVLAAWTVHWQIVLGPLLVLVVLFARGGLLSLLLGGRRRG